VVKQSGKYDKQSDRTFEPHTLTLQMAANRTVHTCGLELACKAWSSFQLRRKKNNQRYEKKVDESENKTYVDILFKSQHMSSRTKEL
jgi:hypothetical protein